MNEKHLQHNCVTWFHNHVKEERGTLFAILNETNKGASKLGQGLLKGASDNGYISRLGEFVGLEFKYPGNRHSVNHLIRQIEFAERIMKRGGLGYFVFFEDQFKHIMADLISKGVCVDTHIAAQKTIDYVKGVVDFAKLNGNKTCCLNPDKSIYLT